MKDLDEFKEHIQMLISAYGEDALFTIELGKLDRILPSLEATATGLLTLFLEYVPSLTADDQERLEARIRDVLQKAHE